MESGLLHTSTGESTCKCIYLTAVLDYHWKWEVENGGRLVSTRNNCREWNNWKNNNNRCNPGNNSKWDKFIHGGFHSPLLHPRSFLHLHYGAGMETCSTTDMRWLNSCKSSINPFWPFSWALCCVLNNFHCQQIIPSSIIQDRSQILHYLKVSHLTVSSNITYIICVAVCQLEHF